MPIRYIGRESHFHGMSLFEIARNLRNFGEGRFVYRVSFSKRYEEPSFYKLTSVKPDMNAKGYCKGTAAGEKYFRGRAYGNCTIGAGMKHDWRLIPKDKEHVWLDALKACEPKPPKVVSDKYELPPLMKQLFLEDLIAGGLEVNDSTFSCDRVIKKCKFNNAVYGQTSTETDKQDLSDIK